MTSSDTARVILDQNSNYWKLYSANIIIAGSMGIFTPAFFIFLSRSVGDLQFGFALGLTALAASGASFCTGYLADALKTQKALCLSAMYIALALLIMMYPVAASLVAIYILQFIVGVIGTTIALLENIMVSLFTEESRRGRGMGILDGSQGLIRGLAMILGGGLSAYVGFGLVCLAASVSLFIGAVIVARIREA